MEESKHMYYKKKYRSNKHIAKNIRLMRHLADMTQTEAAGCFNMSRSNYCNIESGQKMPELTTVCMIADYYGVSLDYIIRYDISEHFMSMLTAGDSELQTMAFAEKYLKLSCGARQQINDRINKSLKIEKMFSRFQWRYENDR